MNENGVKVLGPGEQWYHQDLVYEAKKIATRLKKLRQGRYHEQIRSYGPMRIRMTKSARQAAARLADISNCKPASIRQELASEIELKLGPSSKVVCGRFMITVKQF